MGVTTAIAVTIGLAAGGNLAIASVLDRLLFRPAGGVDAPSELRRLHVKRHVWNGTPYFSDNFSYPDFRDLSDAAQGLAGLAAYTQSQRLLSENGRFVGVTWADPGLFSQLGVRMLRGRFFTTDDESVAVISFRLWNSSFGADPHILGRSLTIDRNVVTVIGVAPRDFTGLDLQPTEIWLPLASGAGAGELSWRDNRDARFLEVVVRLSGALRANPDFLEKRLTETFRAAHMSDVPHDPRAAILTGPIPRARGPGELQPLAARTLSLVNRLSVISLLVLILAIGNCASLLLLRANRRRRDIEIRIALGLTRRRLAMELSAELVLLAAASAGAAMLIGSWASRALQAILLPATDGNVLPIDLRGVLGGSMLAAAAVALAGTGPALLLLRVAPSDLLKSRSTRRLRSRTRTLTIVLQTAMSVLLVSIAMHFVASIRSATSVRLGFDLDHLIAIVTGPADRRTVETALSVASSSRFTAEVANTTSELPTGMAMTRMALPSSSGDSSGTVSYNAVDPNYFRVIGARMVRGRSFLPSDKVGGEPVAVISEAILNAIWKHDDPIGQCVSALGACRRVVGIVRDVRWNLTNAPAPHFYIPLAQSPLGFGRVVYVRTLAPATSANVASLQRALIVMTDSIGIPPRLYRVADRLEPQLQPLRGAAGLLLGYAVLIMCSACIGIYGKISFDASQRAHELAVRAALGAKRSDLIGLLLESGMRLVGTGLILGIVAVTISAGFSARLLFDSSGSEPIIVGGVVTVLCLTAMGAMLLAGRRATATGHASSLNSE